MLYQVLAKCFVLLGIGQRLVITTPGQADQGSGHTQAFEVEVSLPFLSGWFQDLEMDGWEASCDDLS